MNLRCIAQTAALLGRFGKKWVQTTVDVDDLMMAEYLKHTHLLHRLWEKRIQANRSQQESLYALSLFADEILVSELLTRAMGAELLVLGERTLKKEPSKIAFKSMSDHYKFRQHLFDLIEQRPEGTSTFLRCQRLARKIERWSDLLISPFTDTESAVHASFDEERCLDFGDQWYREQISSGDRATFQVQLAALSVTIPNQEIETPSHRESHLSRNQAALSFVASESEQSHVFGVAQLCRQMKSGDEMTSSMLTN